MKNMLLCMRAEVSCMDLQLLEKIGTIRFAEKEFDFISLRRAPTILKWEEMKKLLIDYSH